MSGLFGVSQVTRLTINQSDDWIEIEEQYANVTGYIDGESVALSANTRANTPAYLRGLAEALTRAADIVEGEKNER